MKEKKYLILGIATVLITLIGVTYAYFTTKIIGDRKNVSVDMADLKIVFNNGDAIQADNIKPGWSTTNTFSVENQTRNVYKYNIVIERLINTFVTKGFLKYKITSTDGGYNMTEFKDVPKNENYTNEVLAYSVEIPANTTHNYTIEFVYETSDTVDQSDDMGKILSGNLYISKGSYPNLLTTILKDNSTISERTDFSTTFTENTTGTLFKTNKTEDGSDVYYYAGNTTNNWVKFGKTKVGTCTYNDKEVMFINLSAGYAKQVESENECISTNICSVPDDDGGMLYFVGITEEQCASYENYTYSSDKATYGGELKDIYWRIIRTNEDKSIKLLYSGTSHDTTEGYIGASFFNDIYDNPLYTGYMYGTSGSLANNRTNENSSTIKTYIDAWYEGNLLTNYDKYISKSAIYCNDRSIGKGMYTGYFDYGAYTRLRNSTPTYKCGGNGTDGLFETTQAIADKFSASTESGGNGQLKYPIALMTADEVVFAGAGTFETNLSSPYAWYYSNSIGSSITGANSWHTITPAFSQDELNLLFAVNGSSDTHNGTLTYGQLTKVRPSLALSSCVNIKSGIGTPDEPYVVDYEGSTC